MTTLNQMTDLSTRFENAVCAELATQQDGSPRHLDIVDFIWDGGMQVVANGEDVAWVYHSGTPDVSGSLADVVRLVADRYRDATGYEC